MRGAQVVCNVGTRYRARGRRLLSNTLLSIAGRAQSAATSIAASGKGSDFTSLGPSDLTVARLAFSSRDACFSARSLKTDALRAYLSTGDCNFIQLNAHEAATALRQVGGVAEEQESEDEFSSALHTSFRAQQVSREALVIAADVALDDAGPEEGLDELFASRRAGQPGRSEDAAGLIHPALQAVQDAYALDALDVIVLRLPTAGFRCPSEQREWLQPVIAELERCISADVVRHCILAAPRWALTVPEAANSIPAACWLDSAIEQLWQRGLDRHLVGVQAPVSVGNLRFLMPVSDAPFELSLRSADAAADGMRSWSCASLAHACGLTPLLEYPTDALSADGVHVRTLPARAHEGAVRS